MNLSDFPKEEDEGETEKSYTIWVTGTEVKHMADKYDREGWIEKEQESPKYQKKHTSVLTKIQQ